MRVDNEEQVVSMPWSDLQEMLAECADAKADYATLAVALRHSERLQRSCRCSLIQACVVAAFWMLTAVIGWALYLHGKGIL